MLAAWRDNDAMIQAAVPHSALMSDLPAVSTRLCAKLPVIGLAALDPTSLTADAKQKDLAFLESASKPQGVLLNVIAPIVAELVKSDAPRIKYLCRVSAFEVSFDLFERLALSPRAGRMRP